MEEYDYDALLAEVCPARREFFAERIARIRAAQEWLKKSVLVVREMAVHMDATLVAKTLDMNRNLVTRMSNNSVLAIREKLQEYEQQSSLRAEYVRDYIKSILDFKPTDYFQPAPEGGWMIADKDYNKLPENVARLIEDIELRNIRGNTFLAVRFISKTAALAMAAKYTLTQSMQIDTTKRIDWDELAKVEKRGGDLVEERLRAEEVPA